MKKFILKTALFLLPIAILAITMEYYLRQIPNNYSYKSTYLERNSGDVQILILGSSHPYYGINPDYFSQHTFNASYVSQTLDLDFEIFNIYIEKFDNLRVVILPVSYFTLWSKLTERGEPWRVKNYTLYYGINAKYPTDYSELLNNKLGLSFQRLYRYLFEKKDDISCSMFGWGADYNSENADDLEKTGKITALRHTYGDLYSKKNARIFAENIDILNNFAKLCEQNNIKLIFLTMPVYRTYRENLNEAQLKKMIETMSGIVIKYENSSHINWLEHADFVAGDFYDADHLNEIGAKKLSLKLASAIDSLGILF